MEETEYSEDNVKLDGFYRAKVIDNKDKEFYGRIKVWIPDVMPKISDSEGLWALPANNYISGLNDPGDDQHYYSGSSYVIPIGSWCWVFFENANPSRPFYFAGLNIENVKILPECQLGGKPERKWVIYKSRYGRCIVISDDPDDERVEITGKKRKITDPPTGDKTSVYQIEPNQTTFLHDERSGKQKILIRTYKSAVGEGDYIHVDIDERQLQIEFKEKWIVYFHNDILIRTDKKIHIHADNDILIHTNKNFHLKADQNIKIEAGQNIDIKAGMNFKQEAGLNMDVKAGLIYKTSAGLNWSAKAGLNLDCKAGLNTTIDGGLQHHAYAGSILFLSPFRLGAKSSQAQDAQAAGKPTNATKAEPKGERDT